MENTSLYPLLQQMKIRLGMYIQPPTLPSLQNFIFGYQMALGVHKIDENLIFSKNFSDFVAQKYHFHESTAGFANMILAVAMGFDPQHIDWDEFLKHSINKETHQKAIDLFFSVLEEYSNQ